MKSAAGLPVRVAPQAEIARELEDLERRSITYIINRGTPQAYYGLTDHGRDFMLERLHTQHPPSNQRSATAMHPTGAGNAPPPAERG